MRTRLYSLAALAALVPAAFAATPQEQAAARDVILRYTGQKELAEGIELGSLPEKGDCPAYTYEVKDGKLVLKGSDGVALCKGFYDFVTAQGAGICSWSGTRCELPSPLPEGMKAELASPVAHHQYFNVVTFGYTMPYWDWQRWEQELDWMALHGIDMPLALVAQEAISYRVFRKLGLTDEEINAWFTGPAHLPWMRMGNISGHDGGLTTEWHADQVAMQHRILDRARELGMTPVCPGFSGFVPKAMQRLFPDTKLTETKWGGHFHNYMVDPADPLFARISTMFIEEWEAEFGKCSHYIMDSFNEMEIPFPPHGSAERYDLLARYGEAVYKAMEAASPGAVWVMQGWMFGYQRNIWDERTLAALLSRVPDGQMLLLDMAVDYNLHFWRNGTNYDKHKGFYGKPWIYSVIPNMGGKTGLTGKLEFYANGHLAALRSPNRGKLAGMGMAPEGIENNEVIYELVANAGWRDHEVKLTDWLAQYSRNRYGKDCPRLAKYWELMLKSVYGTFTDHPRYGWQRRPSGNMKGSIYANKDFHEAVDAFAACADELGGSELYRADLMELAVASLGGYVEDLMQAAQKATREGNATAAARLDREIEDIMLGMDRLLASHPTHRLDHWLALARSHAKADGQAKKYESNARRIVTIWGPPVDDYAAKVWSGLIRDYYLPRWKQFRASGGKAKLADWERRWVEECPALSPCEPNAKPVEAAQQLLARAKAAVEHAALPAGDNALAYWDAASLGNDWQELDMPIDARSLQVAKGLRFVSEDAAKCMEIGKVRVIMDGVEVVAVEDGDQGADVRRAFTIPAGAQGNNECRIVVTARNPQGGKGRIELLK